MLGISEFRLAYMICSAGPQPQKRLTRRAAEPLAGVVDYLRPLSIGIRADAGLYCFHSRPGASGREELGSRSTQKWCLASH